MDGSSGSRKSGKVRVQRQLDDVAEQLAVAAANVVVLERLLGRVSPKTRAALDTLFSGIRDLCDDDAPAVSGGALGSLYEALRAEDLLPCPDCDAEEGCSCAAEQRAAAVEEAAHDEERA